MSEFLPYIIALVAVLFAAYAMTSKKEKPRAEKVVYPIILGMATGNPPYRVSQDEALKVAQNAPGIESVKPVLERIYGNSKINFRHMAVCDFTPSQKLDGDEPFYSGSFNTPVNVRLDKFKERAVPLVTRIAKEAIKKSGVKIEEIAKLVVVSSTGFLGPGLDCEIIKTVGLSRGVDRTLIGFMGCAAAMNGFRVANDFVKAHKGKKALLVCVEVSSVHTTFQDNINDAILHAIFADGCACAVLSGEYKEDIKKGTLAIVDDHACLMEGTEDGITLSINPDGISCTLSKYLPQYIAKNMGGYVDTFLAKKGLKREDMEFWAVHPGGRRILEEAENGLGLTEKETEDSWYVLGNYGNMLSPSVMFVLDRIFAKHEKLIAAGGTGYKNGIAFSFSPGVGAEGILLSQVN